MEDLIKEIEVALTNYKNNAAPTCTWNIYGEPTSNVIVVTIEENFNEVHDFCQMLSITIEGDSHISVLSTAENLDICEDMKPCRIGPHQLELIAIIRTLKRYGR